jgi:DNA-binding FadR family transcriptional regulator
MIDRRELAEGARLPAETVLAQQFGVSRPIVRETLARLREEGLVASRRGSGSFVQRRPPPPAAQAVPAFHEIDSVEQIRQSYEFRRAVEGDAAFLAARMGGAPQLEDLRRAIERLDEAVAAKVVGSEADFQFHAAVARASGNSWFISALEAMRGQIEQTIGIARTLSLGSPDGRLQAVQAEHVAVYDAIRRRDPSAAREAMREHLKRTCDRIFRGPGG